MYYRRLDPDEENQAERKLVDLAARLAAKRLNTPVPELRFIVPDSFGGEIAHAGPIGGILSGGKVFIVAGCSPIDTVRAVAHELEHFRQHRAGEAWKSTEVLERGARLFEEEFLGVDLDTRATLPALYRQLLERSPLDEETLRAMKRLGYYERRNGAQTESKESDEIRRRMAPSLSAFNKYVNAFYRPKRGNYGGYRE